MSGHFEARLPIPGEWFDLWHTHVDWHGVGNTGADVRRETLRALFTAWGQVEALASGLNVPWQSWAVIELQDSRQDAVYLHTPKPNRDNFPYQIEDVVRGLVPPEWLAEFTAGGQFEVGWSDCGSVDLYWLRRPIAAKQSSAPFDLNKS